MQDGVNIIDKFSFTSDADATDVGDLLNDTFRTAGQSSANHGYVSGGLAPGVSNVIQKFTFATDANATDVGDLVNSTRYMSGQSSGDNGYTSGGRGIWHRF